MASTFTPGQVIGLCAESHCRFDAPIVFPETVDAGLRVGRLGRRSVTYEIGLFLQGTGRAAWPRAGSCTCSWTARRAGPAEIPPPVRACLERLEAAA